MVQHLQQNWVSNEQNWISNEKRSLTRENLLPRFENREQAVVEDLQVWHHSELVVNLQARTSQLNYILSQTVHNIECQYSYFYQLIYQGNINLNPCYKTMTKHDRLELTAATLQNLRRVSSQHCTDDPSYKVSIQMYTLHHSPVRDIYCQCSISC